MDNEEVDDLASGAPDPSKTTTPEPAGNGTERAKEKAPEPQNPQPPPFLFPFFPFRPEVSQQPATPQFPFTFPFPFLFPGLARPPSQSPGRALEFPDQETLIIPVEEDLRRNPTDGKKKPKKKKKQQQKKPKTPKPIVIYQKDDQIALEGVPGQPGLSGQFANGNQGSYLGYYMVYLVEVTWNGSNQTQTVIAGRPIVAAKPTESAQITDLSGAIMTENPYKPVPATTTCLFQRSTTTGQPMDRPEQEIISEEMETEEYDEDDPKKKKKKAPKTAKTEAVPSPVPSL
ncbi:UNVERIFIED_CONTAM: hypothetical protein PYX00_004551 [Menopon gallinae]|uniref:Uncharacterized protein n=1 Tax=Menopon gallinae TaxID=328185 RepID=A0AAW2I559_9NEOP